MEWYEFINELYNTEQDRYLISYRYNWYGRMYRSKWVWLQSWRTIPKWYVLHHIDHNRKNDVVENLICISRWEHNKMHANDENHYMFRKWHSYWSHPKSDEHKWKIKQSHIERAKLIKKKNYELARNYILQNWDCLAMDLLKSIWKVSWKFFTRNFDCTFLEFKTKILNGETAYFS